MQISKFSLGLGICTCLGLATVTLGDSNGAEVTPCEADLNGDGIVDGADLGQLLLNFFKTCDCDDATAENNDSCACRVDLGEGEVIDRPYDTTGATTDGPEHEECNDGFADPQVGSDIWYNWTSDRDGSWTVSLCIGATYDTKLAVYDGCGCELSDANLIDCEDDTCGLVSSITFDAVEGNCYKIRIGGFGGGTGSGLINITQGGGGSVCDTATGDCCTANGGLGCNQPACCASVCAADPFCCDVAWDGLCSGAALTNPDCDCGGGECDCAVAVGIGCPANAGCEDCVCGADPFCCDVAWDSICAGEATGICAEACCDGGKGGVCDTATGDCCSANGGLGCNQPACCESVCAADPFCCETAWDGLCSGAALTNPACDCGGGGCPAGGGDCCTPSGGLGCDQPACCESVCAADPFCCDVAWDGLCSGAALTNPACKCGGGECDCSVSGGIGCPANAACEGCVCGADPFCCDVAWDSICAGEATGICAGSCCG